MATAVIRVLLATDQPPFYQPINDAGNIGPGYAERCGRLTRRASAFEGEQKHDAQLFPGQLKVQPGMRLMGFSREHQVIHQPDYAPNILLLVHL
jgi:hypothetical protein